MKNILINLADHYPQAPVVGGTPKMNEAITEINRIGNEEYDLIYSSGIKINNYINLKEIVSERVKEKNVILA